LTVPIISHQDRNVLTIDPLVNEIFESTKKDHWGRRRQLKAELLGQSPIRARKIYNTSARRKVTGRQVMMTQHNIQMALNTANERVLERGYRAGRFGGYYPRILEFAHECLEKGLGKVTGIPCHWQNCIEGGIIWENNKAFSMSKTNGHKYYHIYCAERLSLL
jgi:hypothetical protein